MMMTMHEDHNVLLLMFCSQTGKTNVKAGQMYCVQMGKYILGFCNCVSAGFSRIPGFFSFFCKLWWMEAYKVQRKQSFITSADVQGHIRDVQLSSKVVEGPALPL